MIGYKTIRLSYEDISLISAALAMAEAQEKADAERYEEWADRYQERNYDEADRDRMLLAAADCRKRAEEYRLAYKAVWAEVR